MEDQTRKRGFFMNRKGQMMSLLFALLVFIILWAMFFGKWLSDWGQRFIAEQSLTGLQAFLVANMNIWVLAGLIIGVITTIYVGGSN